MALVSAKVVAGNADMLNARHGFLSAEEGVALGAFDIHLEEGNFSDAEAAAKIVESAGGRGHRGGGFAVGGDAVFEPGLGFDDADFAGLVHEGEMDGGDVGEAIEAAEIFEGFEGNRMGLDGDDAAGGADEAGKSEGVFAVTRAGVNDGVALFGLVEAEPVVAGFGGVVFDLAAPGSKMLARVSEVGADGFGGAGAGAMRPLAIVVFDFDAAAGDALGGDGSGFGEDESAAGMVENANEGAAEAHAPTPRSSFWRISTWWSKRQR